MPSSREEFENSNFNLLVGENTDANGVNKTVVEEEEALKIDEVDANTTYIGYAKLGTDGSASTWKVKKVTVSGTVTTIQYADGNKQYDNVWDNRASLTYA